MPRRDGVQRSPTFFVGAASRMHLQPLMLLQDLAVCWQEKQKKDLEAFQRRDQQLAEAYYKNKALCALAQKPCFNASAHQRTHPAKARMGHRDADATLVSPMVVGVADGVSQIEEYGIDSSQLPTELLRESEDLAFQQLLPGKEAAKYHGPIPLVREAFSRTECLGSTTLVLALLDNSTKIHGKLHPMIAVISIGDCELVILRRLQGRQGPLELVFHTEMQRVDGHCQTPLQLARVDDRIDANFDDSITVEVIERGSAVHCISAYEGDIVLVGSDGVFDNLYLDEVTAIANTVLPPGSSPQRPIHSSMLTHLSKRIVEAAHMKTQPTAGGFLPEAPIGRGGKMDDTSCVVAEIIEWTEAHQKLYAPVERPKWTNFWRCRVGCDDENELQEYDGEMTPPGFRRRKRDMDDDDDWCSIS
ncbi:unnamed protein product [Effrenium voratum]|uniref:Protein phosphatase n=1 Tax=Effrenium voratum TaxID=2562239 RepID=A0AA36J440_9DINO|nr:unnamed protein product [Effrenium voratum]